MYQIGFVMILVLYVGDSFGVGRGGCLFGVYFWMVGWKVFIVIVVLLVMFLVIQFGLYLFVGFVESGDLFVFELMFLKFLVVNISIGFIVLLVFVFVGWFVKVLWCVVFSVLCSFDCCCLVMYFLGLFVIVGLVMGVVGVIVVEQVGWIGFLIIGMMVGLFIVMFFLMLMQIVGEEIMFCGVFLFVVGLWFWFVKLVFFMGFIFLSVMFVFLYGFSDLLLFVYYFFFFVCMVVMGLFICGFEVVIVFYMVNNFLMMIFNVVLSGGGVVVVDCLEGFIGGFVFFLFVVGSFVVFVMVGIWECLCCCVGMYCQVCWDGDVIGLLIFV